MMHVNLIIISNGQIDNLQVNTLLPVQVIINITGAGTFGGKC